MNVYLEIRGDHKLVAKDVERDVADRLVKALIDAGNSPLNIYAELSDNEQGSAGGEFAQARKHLLGYLTSSPRPHRMEDGHATNSKQYD